MDFELTRIACRACFLFLVFGLPTDSGEIFEIQNVPESPDGLAGLALLLHICGDATAKKFDPHGNTPKLS